MLPGKKNGRNYLDKKKAIYINKNNRTDMKKTLFLLVLALTGLHVNAQEADSTVTDRSQQTIDSLRQAVSDLNQKTAQMEEDRQMEKVWKRRKWMTLGTGKTNLDIEDPEYGTLGYSSQAAFSFSFGKTYYLHRKPIAKMIKVGLDVTWLDLNYARYKKGKGLKFNMPSEGDFDDYLGGLPGNGGYDDDYDYPDYDEEDLLNIDLGMHQVEAGVGIGPSVTVTPFRPLNISALNYVKLAAYFHWMPSYSGVIRTRDAEPVWNDMANAFEEAESETVVNHGFCNFFRFGLSLSWKALTIGYEHRWGSAKYNTEGFSDSDFSGDGFGGGASEDYDGDVKMKHSTKSNRFFIGFRF